MTQFIDDALLEALSKYGALPQEEDQFLNTGSWSLNEATGGGWPKGKISAISGDFGSGKTMTCLLTAVEAKRRGGNVVWFDTEGKFSKNFAKDIGLGVANQDYLLIQPNSAEDMMNSMFALMDSKDDIDLIVVDQYVTATREEANGEAGDVHMMGFARLSSAFLRSFVLKLTRTNTVVLFVFQTRTALGKSFSYKTKQGGTAKDFYAAIGVDLDKIDKAEFDKDERLGVVRGMVINGSTYKNNFSSSSQEFRIPLRLKPFRAAKLTEITQLGRKYHLFVKSDGTAIATLHPGTAWYYDGIELGRGPLGAIQAMSSDPELLDRIEESLAYQIRYRLEPDKDTT